MSVSLIARVDALLAKAFAEAGLPVEGARATRSALPDVADLQCNGAMAAAKQAKRPPREIAEAVVAGLKAAPEFAEVSVTGPGFINLRLADDFLSAEAMRQAADAALNVAPMPPSSIVIDFGGPNVAKPLHVGHLRALVIGESLRRLLQMQGADIVSDIHLGDWGLQMGMLISEIRLRWPELAPGATPDLTMADLQRLYPEAAQACKDDPARMDDARRATAALQAGDPAATAVWQRLRDISLAAQRLDIDLLGAHFDLFFGESDVQPLIPGMIEDFVARGVAVESEGALIVPVSEPDVAKPMPPLLLAKSDGAALYATTDLATIVKRVADQDPQRILYVVDQRQALHFEQVFEAARRGGIAPGVDLVHVGFGTVNGPDGKPYKTRQGGVAQLADLLGDAIDKAAERLETMQVDADKAELARTVGLAAVKFADLASYRVSGYIFDPERLVSFEGKTGPYVQYACVRIGSILAKAEGLGHAAGPIRVAQKTERELVLECARFPDAVASATRNLAPNEIADFVFTLAQAYSRFYAECPVLTAATEAERASRLSLCALAREVLARALWLLGIDVPAKM